MNICKTLYRLSGKVVPPNEPQSPTNPDGRPFAIDLVEIAMAEIGRGREIGGNNAGPHVARYKHLENFETGKNLGAWCASFVTWCMSQAGWDATKELGIKRTTWERKRHGAKYVWRTLGKKYGFSDEPVIGSIACWDRGKLGDWRGHVGIVCGVELNGRFVTIEGNRGGAPSMVDRFSHVVGEGRLMGFALAPKDVT